jgi:hypothetical protein
MSETDTGTLLLFGPALPAFASLSLFFILVIRFSRFTHELRTRMDMVIVACVNDAR